MKKLLAVAALLAVSPASAQTQMTPVEARRVLAQTASAIANTVLDERGRAKGDYSWKEGQWTEYEPAWHTGQAVGALVAAYGVTAEPRLLAAARKGGDWWIGQEIRSGPLRGLMNAAHGDKLGPLINFTTIGDGTPGLFALTRVSGDRRYAEAATRSIRWLAERTAVPGRSDLFYNIIDPRTGQVVTDWSPHHPDVRRPLPTQVARPNIEGSPFLDACRFTGDRRLCDRHHGLVQATARRADANGLWMEFEPNDAASGVVHPRFNLWNAEALLDAQADRPNAELVAVALRTARTYGRMMRADGGIDYDLRLNGSIGTASPTGSATAFSGLLFLRLRELGHAEFEPLIHRAARWLAVNRYALDHPDPNLRGMVVEWRRKRGDTGESLIQRDLGTIFATRFFAAYVRAFP